ncbi:hypothetical protein KHA80_06970 [Anaerobacillus sp. HL2]|nr:hypothetical protein KHA80_06970 [Anaerobacillus sp. HL2]
MNTSINKNCFQQSHKKYDNVVDNNLYQIIDVATCWLIMKLIGDILIPP